MNDVISFDDLKCTTPVKLLNSSFSRTSSTRQVKKSVNRIFKRNYLDSVKESRPASSKSTSNRNQHSATRTRFFTKVKKHTINPAQMYHDQAMALIYTSIEDL